ARDLQRDADAVVPAHPRGAGPVPGSPPEPPEHQPAHVVLEERVVGVGVEPRPRLEHRDPDAALRELLRHDRPAAARPDDDDVGAGHYTSSRYSGHPGTGPR